MKAVIIGGSGHFEYALSNSRSVKFSGYAPGTSSEDLSRLESSLVSVKRYDDYHSMLEEVQPDLAIVNPQYYKNAEIIEACLKNDIHCFCEKPLAFNQEDLNRIKRVFSASKAQLGSMMVHRYEPWFYAAKKAVSNGLVGKVLQMTAQKSYKMGAKPDWMKDKQKFGGIIPWVGAHAIDLLQWLAPGPLTLLGANQTTTGNAGQGQVESSASCLFQFEHGQAMAHMDYRRPEGAATHGDDRIRIVGEDGIIEVMNNQATMISSSGELVELPLEDGVSLFDDFVDQIRGTGTNRITAEDAFLLTELCIYAETEAQKSKG